MKQKKRKIKYSAIFFLFWFAFLVLLVDGVLKFQTRFYLPSCLEKLL